LIGFIISSSQPIRLEAAEQEFIADLDRGGCATKCTIEAPGHDDLGLHADRIHAHYIEDRIDVATRLQGGDLRGREIFGLLGVVRDEVANSLKRNGSSDRTRTYNPPVNRLMQACYLVASSCLLVGLDTPFCRIFGVKLFSNCSVTEIFCNGLHPSLILRSSLFRLPRGNLWVGDGLWYVLGWRQS
jgi:hypothetical protein